MVARHITMRGEVIDMERIRLSNGDQVALGNASKNARGDLLGPDRKVLKTQEQIENEWEAARARNAPPPAPVDIKSKDSIAKALANLAPDTKPPMAADQDFEPPVADAKQETPARTNTRRRVIETDV